MRLLRIKNVLGRTGQTRSPMYKDMQDGLFVRPVKIGARAAGWPEHEVEAIVAARIAGANVDALRKLVKRLHDARPTAQAGGGDSHEAA
jgi:prophage regulatory protein